MIANTVKSAIYQEAVVKFAPVFYSPITLFSHPSAKCDTSFSNDIVSNKILEKDFSSIFNLGAHNSHCPARLTFLTPGGKRIVENEYLYFKDSNNGLKYVHNMVEKINRLILIVKLIQIKKNRTYPPSNLIPTSEYVLKKWGFDRYQIPDLPLLIPEDLSEYYKI